MRTSWGSATDTGRVRALNEDALLAYPPVFLVADGMGGHDAGDVASRTVVDEFGRLAGRPSVTVDEVHDCFERTGRVLRGMFDDGRTAGTTVAGVAVAAHDGESYWLVFNIGDSRVYRLVAGELEQISVDHSVVQELLDAGELSAAEAAASPQRHVVTRAVDSTAVPDPDYWMIPAGHKDRVLVCSDGLTSEVDDRTIGDVLRSYPDPQEAAQALVEAAVRAGGRDNVSAVVVDVAMAARSADTDQTVPSQGRASAMPDDLEDETLPRPPRDEVTR